MISLADIFSPSFRAMKRISRGQEANGHARVSAKGQAAGPNGQRAAAPMGATVDLMTSPKHPCPIMDIRVPVMRKLIEQAPLEPEDADVLAHIEECRRCTQELSTMRGVGLYFIDSCLWSDPVDHG